VIARVRARLVTVRDRSPLADHGVRAVDRYLDVQGPLLAAALSYYGFLAVFPMVAVAVGVTSVLSKVAPSVDSSVRQELATYFPTLDVDTLARDGLAVGVVGLVLLAYAGLRWIGALRRSVSLVWDVAPRSIGFVAGLTRDAVSLVLLGGSLLASAVLSVVAQVATGLVGRLVGLGDRPPQVLVHLLVLAVSLVANVFIGWVLFRSLPNQVESEREHVVAAAYFAVGFGVLVQLVGVIVARSGHSVVYGTFAATAGLLVWIAYVSRLILGIAAWAATAHPRTGS
jgi:membrane protein